MCLQKISRDELFKQFEADEYAPVLNRKGLPKKNRDGSIKEASTGRRSISEGIKRQLEAVLARPDVVGMILFRNVTLDSSELGRCSALPYGPGCTYKTLEEIGGRPIGDVPSRFQYPESYCLKS